MAAGDRIFMTRYAKKNVTAVDGVTHVRYSAPGFAKFRGVETRASNSMRWP